MKKINLLVIILVLIISGCTQEEELAADKSAKNNNILETNMPVSQSDTGVSLDTEWSMVGSLERVQPIVVHQGRLYASGPGAKAYVLVNNEWMQVGTKEVDLVLVYKNELYGHSLGQLHKLVGGEWVMAAKNDMAVLPRVVNKDELYGRDAGLTGQTYKLEGDRWVSIGKENVVPLIVYNNTLYGRAPYKNSVGEIYKLVGNDWVQVGSERLHTLIIYKNELYGFKSSSISDYLFYKLVGDEWVGVKIDGPKYTIETIEPKIVYKDELYGFDHRGYGEGRYDTSGSALYKLVNNKWVPLGANIVPSVVYNDVLYGYTSKGAYKLLV